MQVAKRKRSHSTYRQELEHACTPLLPHAWLGVIEERMEQWRKKHKRWKQLKNIQRQIPHLLQNRPPSSTSPKKQLHSKSCYSHPNPSILSSKASSTDALHSVSLSPTNSQSHSTCRSLSDAQLLAASPRGTRLEETACVVLYRSRGDVSIPDIGRRCPRLSTLSLTKCGAMRMVDKESEEVGGVWEELVELNLQVCTLHKLLFIIHVCLHTIFTLSFSLPPSLSLSSLFSFSPPSLPLLPPLCSSS